MLLLTETHEDSLFCRFLLDCFDFATFLILAGISFTGFCGFKIFSLYSIRRPDLVVRIGMSGVVERLVFLDLLVALELLVFLESVFELVFELECVLLVFELLVVLELLVFELFGFCRLCGFCIFVVLCSVFFACCRVVSLFWDLCRGALLFFG